MCNWWLCQSFDFRLEDFLWRCYSILDAISFIFPVDIEGLPLIPPKTGGLGGTGKPHLGIPINLSILNLQNRSMKGLCSSTFFNSASLLTHWYLGS